MAINQFNSTKYCMLPTELTAGETENVMQRDSIIERKIATLPKNIKLDTSMVWSSRRTVNIEIIHRERVIVTDINTNEIVLNVKVGDHFRIANEVRDWEVVRNQNGFIEFVKYGNNGNVLRTTHVRPGKYLMARTSGEVRTGMFHRIKPMPLSKIFERSTDCQIFAYDTVKATPIDININGCGLYWIDPDSLEYHNVLGGERELKSAKLYVNWYPFIKLENGTFKPIDIIESPREQDWHYSESSTILAREWCHKFVVSDIKSKDNKYALAFWGSMLSLFVNNNIK